MKVIESWEPDHNFWDINPQLKVVSKFAKLYNEDKTKSKAQSSKLMWAIAFVADFDSKFRSLSEDERKKLVSEDYLKEPEFDWTTVDEQIKGWEIFMSPAQKQMIQWERLMNEKDEWLKTLKFDGSTADEIEKRLMSNVKLYEAYDEIKARLSKESDTGIMMGGGMESLSERGEI
ncbi:MAG: hypothetical protein ACK518_03695 [bacterium]